MGLAEQWQERVVRAMSSVSDLVILNPRRDDWDSNWEQRADDPQFYEQVSWELDMLESLPPRGNYRVARYLRLLAA